MRSSQPDADFVRLSLLHGAPPKVIKLDRMDYSTNVAADLIRRFAIAIAEFGKSAKPVLILLGVDTSAELEVIRYAARSSPAD